MRKLCGSREISSFVADNWRQGHPVFPSEGELEKKQKEDFMTKGTPNAKTTIVSMDINCTTT